MAVLLEFTELAKPVEKHTGLSRRAHQPRENHADRRQQPPRIEQRFRPPDTEEALAVAQRERQRRRKHEQRAQQHLVADEAEGVACVEQPVRNEYTCMRDLLQRRDLIRNKQL